MIEFLSAKEINGDIISEIVKGLRTGIEVRLKEVSMNLLASGPVERGEFVGRSSFLLSASRSVDGISEWMEDMETSGIPKITPDALMILRPWVEGRGIDFVVERLSLDDLLYMYAGRSE